MEENFAQIRSALKAESGSASLERLQSWTHARTDALRALLEQRKRDGHVRECHGDMHRGNIALVDDDLVIFDGIEFDPGLRWIDTMSELAFLVMDLEEVGETPQARRLLNRYLEIRGDYEGLRLLDFYKVYRAMVRAKVAAIRLGQSDLEPVEASRILAEYERYLALAERYTLPRSVRLFLTHGLSGSGKSRLAIALRERAPIIHIRSDVERKRLHGLHMGARTDVGVDAGIYSCEAGRRTYARLGILASAILAAGYSPMVDATFLRADQRRRFLDLAARLGAPCTILDVTAPEAVLRERVAARQADARDPSEAGLAVLEAQIGKREPLAADEREQTITVDTGDPSGLGRFLDQVSASRILPHD
jgi:predicted kinase